MDLIDGYDVLPRTLGWHGPQFARDIACPSYIAIVPRLQIWHRHWLVPVQSVCDLHFKVPEVLRRVYTGPPG